MEHNELQQKRGTWGSNFGFLMAAVGSAVGLGNIWGFPYKMGKNGGFAFLIVYLVLVIFVGVVVMLGELAIGRKTGLATIGAYKKLSKKYTWIGFLGVLSAFFILAFYSVLGGMVLRYTVGFFLSIFGADGFSGAGTDFFGFLLYSKSGMLVYYAVFMVINILIVAGGVKGGIEKFSSIAMPALAVMIIIVIAYVAFQPGAIEGYKFMFKPDFTPIREDFYSVLKTAAGQMFFSLSLGMGIMITYGSYLEKSENLQRNSLIIPASDTIIAILAGCAVMPACAAFGVDFGKGPGLLFVSMQQVFTNMGGIIGSIMGFLFYFLVLLAAVTSSISLLEANASYIIDRKIEKGKNPNRKKITIVLAVVIFLVGIPVALDALGSGDAALKYPAELFGMSDFPVALDCWLDLYDCISEGIMMPLGAMLMSLLVGWKLMPTWKHPDREALIVSECEENGFKFKAFTFFEVCFKFIVPIVMVIVLAAQIGDFF